MKQRLYVDGKLTSTTRQLHSVETCRKWLDNAQREWSSELSPLVAPGEFDPNNGHEVTRVSPDELLVTTTGNKKLRFLNVEVKG